MSKLFDYQKKGVAKLVEKLSTARACLLADEQGLGKTLQAIKVSQALEARMVLVLCPSSLKANWQREFLLHSGLRSMIINKASELTQLYKIFIQPTEPTIFIVGYPLLSKLDASKILIDIDMLIVDECHYLKGGSSAVSRAFDALYKEHNEAKALFLSATPMPNCPDELYNLLHWVSPDGFNYTRQSYRNAYCDPSRKHIGNGNYVWDYRGASNIDKLKSYVDSVSLRRLKQDVMSELPEKTYSYVPLSSISKSVIEQTLLPEFEQNIKGLLMDNRLMKALHVLGEAKAVPAAEYVQDLLDSGLRKCVIFAWHSNVIETIASELKDYCPAILTGQIPSHKRQAIVDTFQNDNSCRVFIGNLQAAGVGITLTAADTVVFVELSWVPAINQQAADRIHRIGQKNACQIITLYAGSSIEEKVMTKLIEKTGNIEAVIAPSEDASINHIQRSHASFSPSAASRWAVCTASYELEKQMPASSETAYQAEGTLAHEAAHWWLTQADDLINPDAEFARLYPDAEMREYVKGYAEFVKEKTKGMQVVRYEHRIKLLGYEDECFGTADVLATSSDSVVIIDLKYGQGVAVDAHENSQLKAYLACCYAQGDARQGSAYIYQPRIKQGNVISAWNDVDIFDCYLQIITAIDKIQRGDTSFAPGEKACRWCKAKAVCTARQDLAIAGFNVETPAQIDVTPLRDRVKTMSLETIAAWLDKESEIKDFLKDVRAYATEQAKAGKEIQGYGLTEAKTIRKIKDEENAAAWLLKHGYAPYEQSIKSITKIEKEVTKEHKKQFVEQFVVKPAGALVLSKQAGNQINDILIEGLNHE